MSFSRRCIVTLVFLFALTACDTPEPVLMEAEPVIEAPVIVEPVYRSPVVDCPNAATGLDDGIGGTGCSVE